MKKIYITRRIPDEAADWLRRRGFRVDVNPRDRPLSPRELAAAARGRQGLITQLVDRLDAGFFASAKGLRVAANYAVGHDNVDLAAARAAGVVVTNTPDVLTEATAEIAWGLLLSAARRIAEGDALTRAGGFKGWAPLFMLGQGVTGKTLGIVGAGRIGTAMALMSAGFRMKVLYAARRRNRLLEKRLGARRRPLDRLLGESDFVSLHAPGSAENRGLLDARRLRLMKRGAVLVNTARGTLVDERALVRALREKRIFAAGLDVYEKEPRLAPGLAKLPNAVLAPHAGSATLETRTRMALLAAENVAAVLSGRPPLTPVGARP